MSAPAGIGRLLMIGCGNMGGAMLHRWIDAGAIAAGEVQVVDPGTPRLPTGVSHVGALDQAGPADTILLAMKPQQLGEVRAAGLSARAPGVLLSILAGVELAILAEAAPGADVVRVMPNLPVAIGKGVVALHGPALTPARTRAVVALMAPLGLVEWIGDERLFDAVTALSGSGPAFAYRFIDALAQGGAALGLDPAQALRMALATVEGAALSAAAAAEPPSALAERVASKGGSTRAGLDILDADRALDRLVEATLAAAERRNAELAKIARAGG